MKRYQNGGGQFSPESIRWNAHRAVREAKIGNTLGKIPPEVYIRIAQMGQSLKQALPVYEEENGSPIPMGGLLRGVGPTALLLTAGMAAAEPQEDQFKNTPHDAYTLLNSLTSLGVPPSYLSVIPGGAQVLAASQAHLDIVTADKLTQQAVILYQVNQTVKKELAEEAKKPRLSKTEIKRGLSPRDHTNATEGFSEVADWDKKPAEDNRNTYKKNIGYGEEGKLKFNGGPNLKHIYDNPTLPQQKGELEKISEELTAQGVPNQVVAEVDGGNYLTRYYSESEDCYKLASQEIFTNGFWLEYELNGETIKLEVGKGGRFDYTNIDGFTEGKANEEGLVKKVMTRSSFSEDTRKQFEDLI